MINECLMILRRQKSRRETSIDSPQIESATDAPVMATSPDRDESEDRPIADQISLKEMKALLEDAIATLPQKYRTVYVLREVQQLSTAETAAALGVSAASVKVDLHRARERLKAELLKSAAGTELFAYPAFYCDRMTARVLKAVLATSVN